VQEVTSSILVLPRFHFLLSFELSAFLILPLKGGSKTDNTRSGLTFQPSATCLVSSVRQSVRLLIDWPRVRSPHRVLPFSLFVFAFVHFDFGVPNTSAFNEVGFCATD
jgi:hypothetical protein